MSRAQITLCSRSEREKAVRWIGQAPKGTRVSFKESKRSTDQNSKLWASLTDVATQVIWHGDRLSPDDWKLIFLDGLNREMRNVPSLDGSGVVNLGRSSSNLSKSEFSNLLELIQMFGAQHGVVFHDQMVTEEA
jgi:NinB protein